MERVTGIEPALVGWKPTALPLGHTRTAEREGFEPPVLFSTPVFETGTIDQTRTSLRITQTN